MKLPSLPSNSHPFFNCGNPLCPICSKAYSFLRVKEKVTRIKENFTTDAVAPFVGRWNYPNINVGLLTPPQNENDSWLYDAPKEWATSNFNIPKIIDYRSALINSRTIVNIKSNDKFLELNKEVAMAKEPVDVEIKLKDKPYFRLSVDKYMPPTGPKAVVKKADLTENPKISTQVEKVVDDKDLKAADALNYLYNKNFDENFLSRMLSVGNLGLKMNRKLVPTRWSITAADDTLGKNILSEIRDYEESDFQVYFGGYLGNYYMMLFFPEVWSYELFETHVSNLSRYSTDYETYQGRKNYASNTAGGYYTVRLAILEKLKKIKRQASVLALRFITGDYTLPLGVWVTREAARNSLRSKPIKFSDKNLMLKYVRNFVNKKFNKDVEVLLNNGLLLKNINTQLKLKKFL